MRLAASALLTLALLGATPSGSPSTTASPTLDLRPDAAPRILRVALSKTAFHPGETIAGTVTTSSNVASVEARIGSFFGISVPKTGVGRFDLRYRVPSFVPPFWRGPMTLQLIARNTRGDRVVRKIPISIR